MLRATLAGAAILAVTLALIPFQWISVALRLPLRRRIPVFYHRLLCALMGVRIHVMGARSDQHPLLLVANHSSWLDVPIITALAPVVFVARGDMASWPLFGLLARLQRSVFVDRTRRLKTGEVNAEIAQRLADGDPVVLFAEGTSSDGNRVLPFRTALIGAASDALTQVGQIGQVVVQPLSIAHVGLDGLPMGRRHRPLTAWYGDMDLVPHLIGVLRRGAFDVVVSWGEPVAYDARSDRKAVARTLESRVRRLTAAALRGGLPPAPRPPALRPAAAGHSFLPGKTLRGAQSRNGHRDNGIAEAPATLEPHPEPERPGPTSTQRA